MIALFAPFLEPQLDQDIDNTNESIEWYKSLSIGQRIDLKVFSPAICGVDFQFLTKCFGFKFSIHLLHQKLILEKII